MIKTLIKRGLVRPLHFQKAAFSGGHHHKPFDWRDDHTLNPYYEVDPRAVGTPDPYSYGQPFEAEEVVPGTPFPNSYNPKDLTTNFVGTWPVLSVAETNLIEPHSQNLWDDIAHEWDYESEDLDFQPETFHSQHFRKKGHIWYWVVLGLTPFWLVITEVVYHQMVDGDGLKYQRPPPLNYPDEEDTPDFETYENWKTPEFTYLHDSGILRDPYIQSYLDSSTSWTARRSTTNGQESINLVLPSSDPSPY
jgi:hypothetical protein